MWVIAWEAKESKQFVCFFLQLLSKDQQNKLITSDDSSDDNFLQLGRP